MNDSKPHVCPVAAAGSLDNRLRRWVQNPVKIVGPYVQEGMTILDLGCGPGFFTLDMARMVGPAGCVIACDLQAGMLARVRRKLQGTDLENRVRLHQSRKDRIGWSLPVDFVLAFYVVHELADVGGFFREIGSILKPAGRVLVVEPPLHVSRKKFEAGIKITRDAGFMEVERPRMPFDKAVVYRPTTAHPVSI